MRQLQKGDKLVRADVNRGLAAIDDSLHGTTLREQTYPAYRPAGARLRGNATAPAPRRRYFTSAASSRERSALLFDQNASRAIGGRTVGRTELARQLPSRGLRD